MKIEYRRYFYGLQRIQYSSFVESHRHFRLDFPRDAHILVDRGIVSDFSFLIFILYNIPKQTKIIDKSVQSMLISL